VLVLHSFPTRRSSDLGVPPWVEPAGCELGRNRKPSSKCTSRSALSLCPWQHRLPTHAPGTARMDYVVVPMRLQGGQPRVMPSGRSEEHTSELQSLRHL